MKKRIISQEMIYAYKYILFFAKNGNKVENRKKIAESEGLPLNFISKIIEKLKKSEIVNSHFGIYGGNNLAKNLDELTIYDLMKALHGEDYIRDSFGGSKELFIGNDLIKNFFESIQKDIVSKLKAVTFKEILENGGTEYFNNLEVNEVPKVTEDIQRFKELREETLEENARKEQSMKIAKSLLEVLSIEMIAKKTGLTIQEVEKLKKI